MGIQDDYFDVSHVLEEAGETEALKQFETIWEWACRLEAENEELNRRDQAVKNFCLLMRHYFEGKS